jgi:hypothetical protein
VFAALERIGGHVTIGDKCIPAGGHHETGKHAHGSGFPGGVRAQQSYNFPFANVKIDFIYR